jgi:hypothetical protein
MTNLEICEDFNRVEWHDSKLRSFATVREGDQDNVVFQLELHPTSAGKLQPATLVLADAAYLRADVDLDGKYQCSDDISSARCELDPPFKKELLLSQFKNNPHALDGYFCFDFYLIPPGGRIQIFARSFELKYA